MAALHHPKRRLTLQVPDPGAARAGAVDGPVAILDPIGLEVIRGDPADHEPGAALPKAPVDGAHVVAGVERLTHRELLRGEGDLRSEAEQRRVEDTGATQVMAEIVVRLEDEPLAADESASQQSKAA